MKRLINQFFAQLQVAFYRTVASPGSYLAVMAGVLVATMTICSLIIYAEGVNMTVLRDRLSRAHAEATYDLMIKGSARLMDEARYQALQASIIDLVEEKVGLPVTRVGRHGWTKSMLIVPPGQSPVGQRTALKRTRFQFYSNVEESIELVEGRFPQPAADPQDVVEVMVTTKLAESLALKVGDEFVVEDFTGAADSVKIRTRLAGIIKLKESGGVWLYAPWFLDEALTIPEESYFQAVALAVKPVDAEVTWAVNYDESAVTIDNVDAVLAGLDVLTFSVKNELEGLQLLTSLDETLNEFRSSTFELKALLMLLGAPIIGIALYYITMAAGLLVEYQRGEIAVFKSRGSNILEVLNIFMLQGLLIVLPAVILGPLLALPLAQLIGKADTFMGFTNARVLPVLLRPQTYGFALLAGGLALLAIFMPTLSAARQTIVTYRREVARGRQGTLFHRYYLDVLLVIAGVVGYRTLTQNRSIISTDASGAMQFDPLLVLTPILLGAGLAFLVLRGVPYLFRLLAHIDGFSERAASLFGLRQVARSTGRYSDLILMLTFTLALGLFTASVANAFDRNYLDQSMYLTGADLRLREFDYERVTWTIRPVEEYASVAGVREVSPAARIALVGREAAVTAKGELVAIEPGTLAQIAWWRSDFQPPLEQLISGLQADEKALYMDSATARRYQLQPGSAFDMDIEGTRVDFVLAGTFDYFPTLYPKNGAMVVARLDYLQRMVEVQPNEVWMATRLGQHERAVAGLKALGGKNLLVISNGRELTGVRKDDPLRTGLFGALSLGFVSASVLSILGFLLYAYISIQTRSLQFGVLRATGLSVRQLVGALSTEQLSLIGLGIVLGTVLGGGAGFMFTRFLQVSVLARESIPPFLVSVPWLTIGELYLILVGIFTMAMFFSIYLLRRMRVYSVLRLGEQ